MAARQHPIDPCIVDFYCAQHRLVVELDGGFHRSQAEYDTERTAYLEARNCRVLRVRNEELEHDLEAVLRRIAAACGASALLPESLGEGRASEAGAG